MKIKSSSKSHRPPKGQNIIEYLLLMVSCILIFLVFLTPTGLFRNMVENTMNGTVNQLEDMANNVVFP